MRNFRIEKEGLMKIINLGPRKFIFALAPVIVLCWTVAGDASEQLEAIASASVNLRKKPSLSGEILSIVSKGHKVRILQNKGLWCQVDVDGVVNGRGWVYAGYLERALSKTPETVSSSQTARVPIASAQQKREIPMAQAPAHNGSSQVPLEVRLEESLAKSLNVTVPVKIYRADVSERGSMRNQLRETKNESNAPARVEISGAAEPVPKPPIQPPHSGFKQGAPGAGRKYFSKEIEQGDSAAFHKRLPGEKKKHGNQGTPSVVSEQSVSDSPAVASSVSVIRSAGFHETQGLINKRESIGAVTLALKLLSIVMSCFVILLLYKKIDVKL